MLNSLSGFVFGRSEQNDTGSDRNDAGAQVNQGMELKTQEEELGWVLVDVPGDINPSEPQAREGKDSSLQCPDGSLFDGVLDGLSSCSESCSLSEVEEAEENNDVYVQHPSLLPYSSDEANADQSYTSFSFENVNQLDPFLLPFDGSDDENDCHVVLSSLASSSSSLSVIMEWDENESNCSPSPMSKSDGMDKLTDSWMITPPLVSLVPW